jgi:hypothetical protein
MRAPAISTTAASRRGSPGGHTLWADALTARSGGLTWAAAGLGPDGTHPSAQGQAKVANMLLSFLKASLHARCWFLAGQSFRAGRED